MQDTAQFRYEYHDVNGLTLHVGHLGPASGEKIVFLHGFPEFSESWRKQAGFFAANGYHVIVPDQRGYNLSKKPPAVQEYALNILVADIAALITSLTTCPVIVAGHDWGGGVAWTLAQQHSQLIRKLVILNMPHPGVMLENLRKNPKQMPKSWYVAFFQLPFVPEQLCSAFNFKWLAASMVKTARRGTFSKNDIAAYKRAWRQPNALRSMINWYRAFAQSPPATINQSIEVPALILWGTKDMFLSSKMAGESVAKCARGRLIFIENATHWLHHEKPELVNGYIYAFVRE